MFDDPKRGEEARRVFDDAQRLLSEIVDRRLLRADGVIGLYPPHRTGTISCCTPTSRGNRSG
ncbi:MAG: vitamin B12 dependent-methionine synthase activation domain-containing protein [Alistipes sp.]